MNSSKFPTYFTTLGRAIFMPPSGGHIVIALSVHLSVSVSPSVRHKKLVRSVTPTCLSGI